MGDGDEFHGDGVAADGQGAGIGLKLMGMGWGREIFTGMGLTTHITLFPNESTTSS